MPSSRRLEVDLRALLRLRATWLAAIGAVLIAGALGISAGLTLFNALSPAALVAMAGEGFDRKLRVESVRLEFSGRPRLHVEGVEIEGLGTAAAAEIELHVRWLLRGKIRARTVRLEDPRLVLRRGPGGDFVPIFKPSGGGDVSVLPAVEAEGGEIHIVQGEKLTAVVRLETLSLTRFDSDSSAKLVLAGNLAGGDGRWHTHPLRLRGRLIHAPDRMAFVDGRLRAHHVAVRWWSGRDVDARFRYENGQVEIESLEVRGFGGTWQLNGRVWLRGGMRLELAANTVGVDFAALLAAADGSKATRDLGTLRMRWDPLKIPWRDGPHFEQGYGQGHLRVAGGVLPGTSLLGSWAGGEPKSTSVKSFSALTELRDGRLHTSALRLETGDYTLEAQGSVGLDRSVALEGRLNLAGTLGLPKGAAVLPTVPVTIAGMLPHPTVDTHVSRVTEGGIDAVAEAVQKTSSTVARTTRSATEKLGDAFGSAGRTAAGGLGAVGRKARDVLER